MIYDCFPFFDELDLLELRLEELDPYVDRFVIVEAAQSFSGNSKPLSLRAHWDRYEKFHAKIAYVTLDHLPTIASECDAPWERERYQRNAIGAELEHCDDSDWIIISDCDEIPRPRAIQMFDPAQGITRMMQNTYYYSFNWLLDYGNDSASRCRIGTMRDFHNVGGAENFRQYRRDDPSCPALENAGWHCSYFGADLERIKLKVSSFSHFSEYSVGDDYVLLFDVATGKDLHHRIGSGIPQQLRWMHINDTLPNSFLRNIEKYERFTTNYFIRRYLGG